MHDDFIALALEMIAEDGADAILNHYTIPATGTTARAGLVETPVKLLMTRFDDVDGRAGLIREKGVKFLMGSTAGVVPLVGDTITAPEGTFTIYHVTKVKPGTSTVLYKIYAADGGVYHVDTA